jgi:hypothetical protein
MCKNGEEGVNQVEVNSKGETKRTNRVANEGRNEKEGG